jgi:hypothetical protein
VTGAGTDSGSSAAHPLMPTQAMASPRAISAPMINMVASTHSDVIAFRSLGLVRQHKCEVLHTRIGRDMKSKKYRALGAALPSYATSAKNSQSAPRGERMVLVLGSGHRQQLPNPQARHRLQIGPAVDGVAALILKRANACRPSGHWSEDDYDVLSQGEVAGRIMKVIAAPEATPWMWTLAYGHHRDRSRGCTASSRHAKQHGTLREELRLHFL